MQKNLSQLWPTRFYTVNSSDKVIRSNATINVMPNLKLSICPAYRRTPLLSLLSPPPLALSIAETNEIAVAVITRSVFERTPQRGGIVFSTLD